ncbi:hypothetical protein Pan216_05930 [Planctomycetes bacterium Pan216]|uniref:Uncharacterized protein n=1 Tax=Kolteria novifilia TaxID=2527975 RepID=A0A518AYF7_9BACT|nr:hypothetical protein Pan216_05930 [Planctomycetes bacterium Pan216]
MNSSTSTPITVNEPGTGTLEIFPLPTDEEFLKRLLEDLFANHWQEFYFGTMVQGSVFEIKAPGPPKKIGLLDGYLTVDFGPWHFHLCIGTTKGMPGRPTELEVAKQRQTARAEFYRGITDDRCVGHWGFRMFNGNGDNQLTIFLPNPFLSDEMKVLKTPDWSRLNLWDDLRKTYLGLEPDPKDRTSTKLVHG